MKTKKQTIAMVALSLALLFTATLQAAEKFDYVGYPGCILLENETTRVIL